jgi:membrane protein DedA with SNARE-associated domain
VLVLASITESLANFATDVVDKIGLAGVFVLMTLESACIPIPSEATMLFAGFNVARGEYSLIAATLVGASANLVGSWIAYGVGWFGRIELVERHGRKLHISPKHLATADRWFAEHGEATVFFTRMMPIIRTFISLPAGVARMNFLRFSIFTFLGCLPWVFALAFIGKQAGANWEDWKNRLHYVDYAFAVLIVAVAAYYLVRWWNRRSRRDGGEPPSGGRVEPASEPAADVPA